MENLNTIETSKLVDMLAEYTERYTQIKLDGGNIVDYEKCRLAVAAIQKEIEIRKQSFIDNSAATNEPPEFTV
jgi:hypothetical protein